MSLQAFVEAYEQFTFSEQGTFEEVIQKLLSDGSLWREEEQGRRLFDFLRNHQQPVSAYLETAGWMLHYYEQHKLFHVTHRDGRNRYFFTSEQTRLLLLLRLLYAQQQEQRIIHMANMHGSSARYPVVIPNEVAQEFYSLYGMRLSRTALRDHLRLFGRFKLIRILWKGGQKDIAQADIELLPFLEVLIVADKINASVESWIKGEKKEGTGEAEE